MQRYQGYFYYFAYKMGNSDWKLMPTNFILNNISGNSIFGQFISSNRFGCEIPEKLSRLNMAIVKFKENLYSRSDILADFITLLNTVPIESIDNVVLKGEISGNVFEDIYKNLSNYIERKGLNHYRKTIVADDNETTIGLNVTVLRDKNSGKNRQIINLPFFKLD